MVRHADFTIVELCQSSKSNVNYKGVNKGVKGISSAGRKRVKILAMIGN